MTSWSYSAFLRDRQHSSRVARVRAEPGAGRSAARTDSSARPIRRRSGDFRPGGDPETAVLRDLFEQAARGRRSAGGTRSAMRASIRCSGGHQQRLTADHDAAPEQKSRSWLPEEPGAVRPGHFCQVEHQAVVPARHPDGRRRRRQRVAGRRRAVSGGRIRSHRARQPETRVQAGGDLIWRAERRRFRKRRIAGGPGGPSTPSHR